MKSDAFKFTEGWDKEADVVVVGAGAAGLAAAIEASEAKVHVLVLESMPKCGGSSAISGGGICFAGTDMQKEIGIKDSNDLLFADLMEAGRWANDPELVRKYVDNQLDTYRWLKELGVKFQGVLINEGSLPRAHITNAAKALKLMKEVAEKNGVELLLKSPGRRLVTRVGSEVIGVEGESNEKKLYVKTRKAVILATGGFGRNPKVLEIFCPKFSKVSSIAALGTTGDGLKMAQAVGCDLKDRDYIKASYGIVPGGMSWKDLVTMGPYYVGAIIINKHGKRFCNESLGHKEIPEFVIKQPDGVSFQVFDKRIADAYEKRFSTKRNIAEFKKIGCVAEAESVETLAIKIGVSSKALKETIDKYNSDLETLGYDSLFGKSTLWGAHGKPVKIETPPFYAIETKPVILGTYCGVRIDKETHVINVWGERIPRLYAAGEVTGGFHGDGYVGGTALGKAIVFGRIAGKNAASEKSWE